MTNSIEERMEDFGEEMEEVGDRLGEDIERLKKDIEYGYYSLLGLAGPFLWSLVSLIFLGILIRILHWLGGTIQSTVFALAGDFVLNNIALFFLLILLFNYFSYFSKRSPRKTKYFSPFFTALSITIWIWIITNFILILNTHFVIIKRSISSIHENLLTIFALLVLLSYLLLIINEGEKSEGKTDTMTYEDYGWNEDQEMKRLYRSGKDKLLGGVCGGIGEYFTIDPVIIRIIWVVIAIASLGTAILIYLVLWILIPRNPSHRW